MRNLIICKILLLTSLYATSQNNQANDISTPELSPFAMNDGSLQGAISNSVEEVTGKVVTSVPIANIGARTISYPVTLAYNGKDVFKQAQYLNQYRAQSTLGIGWSLNVPKIITDHKGTTSLEDDTFYLVNGGGPNKLICTNRNIVEFPGTGDSYLDFQTEQFVPFKIRYKINNVAIVNSVYQTTEYDYWEVTDDRGVVYTYGNSNNTKEEVIAWGNWIGDSKNITGASQHSIVWNLSEIQDQWGNNLTFSYDKVEEGINTSGPLHTEAAYISEINSSTGGKIAFNYSDKTSLEYYEPHREQVEPDAYQERYERKYLSSITTYDTADQLVYTYDMDYDYVLKALGDRKQYLKSVTQKDKDDNDLPPQEFEYYTSGNFAGGIKKITYPTGGSITYNYDEKTAFNATNPPIVVDEPLTSGYYVQGSYSGDNYAVQLMSLGMTNPNGRTEYQFKILNRYWIGQRWEHTEFIFPELIGVYDSGFDPVDNLRFVAGQDFYAFMIFNRTTDKASVYLFHKEKNGIDWKRTEHRNLLIQSGSESFPNEDPVLMAGENFVAAGENQGGELYTFVWNGDNWRDDIIQQGIGQYYYGANNNFIISLDERSNGTSGDMVTNVTTHPDNYYIHYLDAIGNWNTKSWSNDVFQNFMVMGTENPSYIYPSNNMAGFMADLNNELIIRWDKNYNLVGMDDVIGADEDTYPLIPVGGNNFSLFKPFTNVNNPGGLAYHLKTVSFDGNSWSLENSFTNNHGQGSGQNYLLTNRFVNSSNGHWFYEYDPNNHGWTSSQLTSHNSDNTGLSNFGATNNLLVAGQYAYRISDVGTLNSLGKIYHGRIANKAFSNSNEIFVNYGGEINDPNSSEYQHAFLLSINKEDNTLNSQSVANGNIHLDVIDGNQAVKQLGGVYPIISNNILNALGNFKKIIDGEINRVVKNKVVSSIEIDDDKGEIRKVFYTYNDSHTLPDDQSTFYGEVIVENKGLGTGNNGKITKYFKKGDEDVREAGLPSKVEVKDKNDIVKSENETEWDLITTSHASTAGQVGISYHIRPKKQIDRVKLNSVDVVTETDNMYNPKGFLIESSRTNSQGETELTNMSYAYENPASGVTTELKNKNMLSFPYQTLNRVGGEIVSVERSEWTNSGSDYYVNEILSGTDLSNLRTDTKITQIDLNGNVQESNNGVGVYKTVLYGYDNLYPVATITNAKFNDVVNELNVTYAQLQSLGSSALETELLALYDQLPEAMININIYDDKGRIVKTFDEREEAVNFVYDSFGRLDHTTDSNEKVIQKKQYNFASN